MIENRENNPYNPPATNEAVTEKVIKSVIFILLIVVLARLVLYYPMNDSEGNDFGIKNQTEINRTDENISEIELHVTENIVRVEPKIIKQPSCPKSDMLVILDEICSDLVLRNELCTPEDFYDKRKHRNPRISKKISKNLEPRASIMNYVVGGLLITSLGAALLELYKAKKQVPRRNGKCPLSRKSSLADLTVMKHQRKELIRRESIMELPEESPQSKQLGRKRLCSFSVGSNASMSYKDSATVNEEEVTELVSQIPTVETRRFSVGDSRRPSILERRISNDYRMMSVEGKRPSIDDSPEKRHHRLVYRH
ncbi:uncharacterized protein LOC108911579 [Anoplophora glabripennis]|uniref:uncharacterized protein LOC108911579 n=1 Tax=Anoplophora glabripennis TaxID=217634 RepID=UPI000C780FCE|nr:uncharacterized protein LOC108911579 [Anoplophora glabripennis]